MTKTHFPHLNSTLTLVLKHRVVVYCVGPIGRAGESIGTTDTLNIHL